MNTTLHNTIKDKNKNLSVMIIEKDVIQRKGIAFALMDYFPEIRSTYDPVEALKAAGGRQFDVIISEINFDSISGPELIEKLHRINPDAVILTITSLINEKTKTDLHNSGAQIIFEKPIEIRNLIYTINKLIEDRHDTA